MQWSEAIHEYMDTLPDVPVTPFVAEHLLAMLDITSLNTTDTEASVALFLEEAKSLQIPPAAVCVYPRFVRMAANTFLDSTVKVATVANFPSGQSSLEEVLIEISRALQDGAREIDVVFPYQRYLAGEKQYAATFVESCKAVCGENVLLKVIMETGVLQDHALIADASYDALVNGADFIKTSTGKTADGATLEAAATMLLVIKHTTMQLKRTIGLKVSGGIRDVKQAASYLALANKIMGANWATPATFRIGASQLAKELLKAL